MSTINNKIMKKREMTRWLNYLRKLGIKFENPYTYATNSEVLECVCWYDTPKRKLVERKQRDFYKATFYKDIENRYLIQKPLLPSECYYVYI